MRSRQAQQAEEMPPPQCDSALWPHLTNRRNC